MFRAQKVRAVDGLHDNRAAADSDAMSRTL
jgi:hypothetical protein